MTLISINGNALHPHAQEAQFKDKGLWSETAENSNYILIQVDEPLTEEQKDELKKLDAEITEYVSENTYMAEYKPTDLQKIRDLPFINWANIYNEQFKIEGRLKGVRGADKLSSIVDEVDWHDENDSHNVEIIFHRSVTIDDDVLKDLSTRSGVDKSDLKVNGHKVRAFVQHRNLINVAGLDGVKAVQEVHKMTLFNCKASEVIGAYPTIDGFTSPFQGEGETVLVGDTGFDLGDRMDCLPAFKDRVVKLWALGRTDKCDDPHGHGTHVAGSVLGDGKSTLLEDKIICGTAPKAKLAIQSFYDDAGGLGGIPDDFKDLFGPPYNDEEVQARVHTNSWGPGATGLPYDQAYQVDKFVWDNQDMVILFAAGNEGIDKNKDGKIDDRQIGLYASAKNSITVGASENSRADITTTYGQYGYTSTPLRSDRTANDPEGMAAFSNRGYTPRTNRIKPDVVAPGTAILSAASRHPEARTGESLPDPDWRFMDGTSMATPLVAGATAVIREAFKKVEKMEFIPAALVKAALINGAVDMKGQYSGKANDAGPSPNTSSGWGRAHVANAVSVVGEGNNGGYQVGEPLAQGKSSTTTITIPGGDPSQKAQIGTAAQAALKAAGSGTLKITLVWTDPPGEILQNDLDLIVKTGGKEYHGNCGDCTVTKTKFDRNNNVEQVKWVNVPPGECEITVKAYRITRYNQPWAYAWTYTPSV